MAMDEKRLAEIEARVNAATAGGCRREDGTTQIWGRCIDDDPTSYGMGYPIADFRTTPSGKWAAGPTAEEGIANAEFSAAACTDIPDLIAEIRAMRALKNVMASALRAAESGLASSYQVCDWPANGSSPQDRALAQVRSALAAVAKAEGRS